MTTTQTNKVAALVAALVQVEREMVQFPTHHVALAKRAAWLKQQIRRA